MQFSGEEQLLVDVCGRIAQEVGDGTTTENLRRFRAYLHKLSLGKQRSYSMSKRPSLYGAGAAVAAIGAAILFFSPPHRPFRFWIGPDEATGIVGQRIPATDREISVTFDQGSNFVIQNGTVAEVVENSQNAVRFNLEDGKILAHVVGNHITKWSVAAGPFEVVVVGTRFSVSWDKKTAVLDVEVKEGTVLVDGARYAEQGINVSQGYALKMDHRTDSFALNRIIPGDAARKTADRTPEIQSPQSKGTMTASAVVDSASYLGRKCAALSRNEKDTVYDGGSVGGKKQHRRQPLGLKEGAEGVGLSLLDLGDASPGNAAHTTWIEYYEQGDYRSAVMAAEKSGIESLVAELNLEDLWNLMHAARSEGRQQIAKTALSTCRKRFGGTKKSQLSAYILGKINYEKTYDFAAAVDWFSTYLRESPTGPLAEEAEGRIVTALDALGRHAEANRAALEYLKKYPRGLFSGTARSISSN